MRFFLLSLVATLLLFVGCSNDEPQRVHYQQPVQQYAPQYAPQQPAPVNNYYQQEESGSGIGTALVGAAVGAIGAAAVMNAMDSKSSSAQSPSQRTETTAATKRKAQAANYKPTKRVTKKATKRKVSQRKPPKKKKAYKKKKVIHEKLSMVARPSTSRCTIHSDILRITGGLDSCNSNCS